MPTRFRLVLIIVLAFLIAWLAAPRTAGAQPFGTWIVLDDSNPGHIQIPHSPQLNGAAAFTLEAWVAVSPDSGFHTGAEPASQVSRGRGLRHLSVKCCGMVR